MGKSRRQQQRYVKRMKKKVKQSFTICAKCSKRSYPSDNLAMEVCRTGGGNRVYVCPHGNGWHVTSKTKVPRG